MQDRSDSWEEVVTLTKALGGEFGGIAADLKVKARIDTFFVGMVHPPDK